MFYISSLVGWTIFCLLVTFSFWKIIFKLLLSFLSEELSSFQFLIQNLFWDTWSNRRPQAKSWRKLYKILSLGIKSGGLTDQLYHFFFANSISTPDDKLGFEKKLEIKFMLKMKVHEHETCIYFTMAHKTQDNHINPK